ncbi:MULTISPECIES: MFS transporter [Paraburkholderia]|uniref:MFS transporter n=1 Tax=Paraburkholderia TaxID=1822464 RepID=UPI0038B8B67A
MIATLIGTIVGMFVIVYAPEVYPTRIRASGAGAASVITRVSSVIGPVIIGALLTYLSVEAVFGYFAIVSLLGSIVIGAFALETGGRTLDEISRLQDARPAAPPVGKGKAKKSPSNIFDGLFASQAKRVTTAAFFQTAAGIRTCGAGRARPVPACWCRRSHRSRSTPAR